MTGQIDHVPSRSWPPGKAGRSPVTSS